MLFQTTPKRNAVTLIRRSVAAIAGLLADLTARRSDAELLDRMRPGELEELGLYRDGEGRHRFF
jgi:hypothetical protein